MNKIFQLFLGGGGGGGGGWGVEGLGPIDWPTTFFSIHLASELLKSRL